jgi:type I restriction enzyme S subunit
VLFGKRRAYQGKVAVADFAGVCSSDIYVLEPKDDRLPRGLLPFVCQSRSFLDHAVETSAGSLSPRTNWKNLETFEFAIPSDPDLLTAAVESAEHLIGATSDLVRAGERVFRSALDDALQLPESYRARVQSVPPGWGLSTLEDVVAGPRSISYGVLKPGTPDPTGVPMLRVMDFDELGRRTTTDVMRVSRAVADSSKTTYLFAGDVIVSIMATIGRTFLVTKEMEGWNVNRALAVLPFADVEMGAYVEAFLQSGYVQRYLDSEKIGSAQPRINLDVLKAVSIPLPPESTRASIVRLRSRLGEGINASADRLHRATELKERLLAVGLAS